jgi:predicted Rossmann fold nucleotide-binding protein DprA/Smf involved in DNA uptake
VCESAEDVFEAVGVRGAGEDGAPLYIAPDHGGAAVRDVLAALRDASFTIDELARRCGLPVSKAAAAVSDLEIEGLARRVDGGRYLLLRR